MNTAFFTSYSNEEFKSLLKEAVQEVIKGETQKTSGKELLNIEEAAGFLDLKVNTLYEKTSLKTIPHFKKGNKLYFRRTELEEWVKAGKVKTRTEIEGEAVSFLLNGTKKTNASKAD